jgi:hypothetical protein
LAFTLCFVDRLLRLLQESAVVQVAIILGSFILAKEL